MRSSARAPTGSCGCGTGRSSRRRRRGAAEMALPDWSAWAILVGVILATIVVGLRPLLARLGARNIGRRKSRVLIVVAGLLVGTAIISSSLVVGDTLSYIFLQDVYLRLDAVDELVSNAFNGQLFSFAESTGTQIAPDLAAVHSPVDGIAPALLKVMPVRNVAGNKGNQQITVMGLNASYEGAFGPLTRLDGRTTDTNELGPTEVFANERAAADLNATPGEDLTLFYGTTNQTIVHASVAATVRDIGKAAYGRRAILFVDLGRAQAAFNESGAINLIRVSNVGGVADGVASSDQVTHDLRLSIARNHLVGLQVDPVKADDIAQAVQVGRDATDLFLVMGAFGILAGVLLIVNIFVMLAEERKPELGVARAVGFLRGDLLATFALEGTFYAVVAAALGALGGLGLGYVMVYFFDKVVPHGEVVVTFHFDPTSVVTAFVAGTALTWITILVASWRVSRLNIVRAIRDLPEPGTKERSREVLIAGTLIALAGAILTAWGFTADTGMGKIPGPPVLAIGLGIAAASRGWARGALTLAAAFNLAWILMPVGLLNQQTDNVSVAFVMTGVILVGSGIVIAVFNVSEALRALLRRANRGAGRPVLKTAVSYPMDKRFRTGMTVAMFALILFMVTLISMLQGLQASSLESFVQQQSGGYDVIAYTTTYSEIPNFRESLRANFSEALFAGGYNGTSSASVMPAKVEAIGGKPAYGHNPFGGDHFLIPTHHAGVVRGGEWRPHRLPAGGTIHGVLLSDVGRRRRRGVPGGPRAGLLRVRPADNRHPRGDRRGVRLVPAGPHAHASVPGDRDPRRNRGACGHHAAGGRRATHADRGVTGDRLHATNGPRDVPRGDCPHRGLGHRDRSGTWDRLRVQDLRGVLRGHRRVQCAMAQPRVDHWTDRGRGRGGDRPARDPRVAHPAGRGAPVHRVSRPARWAP